MGIEAYNPSASLNTMLGGKSVAEGMARGDVSDSIRQLMADIASGVVPVVSIKGFGAVGNGTTDDTAAVQSALNSFGTAGGTVLIPDGMTPLIDSNLNIPDNCALVAQTTPLGRTFSAPNLTLYKPRIILNRSATITLNNSSRISAAIFAKNLTFSDTSANVATWTGTAITLADNKSDQEVTDCLILGFGTAISTGANLRVDRPRIERVQLDCVNGIYIKNLYDVAYINFCEAWPWTTLESVAETNNAHLKRPGAFIQFDGTTNDWAQVFGCFNYGWKTGFRLTGADTTSLIGCGSDNPPGAADASIGFLVEGTSFEPTFIGCKAAGRETGFRIDTTDANGRVYMLGCMTSGILTDAVRFVHGDLSIIGGGLRGTGNGVYMENTATKLRLLGVKLNDFAIGIKTDAAGAKVLHDHCDFTNVTTTVNNPYVPSITSANPLVLDGASTFFSVQGTNNFSTINDAKVYAGKLVTLKFNAALIVSTGGNLILDAAGNFSVTANDTITFRSDGTNWIETSRKVNT
jgi:hypothetical protein